MQNLHCAFCGKPSLNAFEVVTKKKIFHYDICSECKGITLCKDDFLSKEEQEKRYLHHNNDLSNTGYVSFLGRFLENVFSFLRQKGFLKDETYFVQKHICDYGSGPRPVLVELLHVVSCMQRGGDGQKKEVHFSIIVRDFVLRRIACPYISFVAGCTLHKGLGSLF